MNIETISGKMGTKIPWLREMLGEFIGTFLMVFLGNCSVAGLVFSKTYGDSRSVTSVHVAYGFAVTMGILVAGGASGAHLNPAVTLAMAVIGKFPWKKIFHYFVAQYLGAFVAAACTYFIYLDALNGFDGGIRHVSGVNGTAGIWTTFPESYLGLLGGFVDQFLGTSILLLVVCSITDRRNMEVHKSLHALYVGILVITIGISLGMNCGYALNPARDLSPRLFLLIAGWGTEAFTSGDNFWWIPIVGPHLGAIFGSLLYVFMIEIHTAPLVDDHTRNEVHPKRINVLAAT